MSNSADEVAGLMWDDFRKAIFDLKAAKKIDSDAYWFITDLVNDYGYAMKLAGMRGEQTHQVESIFRSVMGITGTAADRTKYDFGG